MTENKESEWIVYSSDNIKEFASKFGRVRNIKRKFFENGNPNLMIEDMDWVTPSQKKPANVLYFSDFRNMTEKKVEEIIIFVLADSVNVNRFVVCDLFDPLATMERVVVEGEIATENVDAYFWKSLPLLESGKKVIRVLYDHHTLQNRFYFTGGNTKVRLYSAIPTFVEKLKELGKTASNGYAIAFPDAGSHKRFSVYFKDYETIVCGKQRTEDNRRIITIEEGNPKDKKVIVVDDLVRSGGTLIECATKIREVGATEINFYCTHAEFPEDSWKKFTPEKAPFEIGNFFITDTVSRVSSQIQNIKPFHVISIVPHLKSVLEQINN